MMIRPFLPFFSLIFSVPSPADWPDIWWASTKPSYAGEFSPNWIGALTNQRFCGSMKLAWDIPRSLRPEVWPTLKGIRTIKHPALCKGQEGEIS